MLPYVVLGVAALLAWRTQSQEAQKPAVPVMTDAQRLIFQNAVSDNGTQLTPAQLTQLAQAFDAEGHSPEAEILFKRAQVLSLRPNEQAVLVGAFKKGLSSKDPVAVRALANSFEAEGFFGNAAKLRDYANSLDVGNVIMQTAAVTPPPVATATEDGNVPPPSTEQASPPPSTEQASPPPATEQAAPPPATEQSSLTEAVGSALGSSIDTATQGALSAASTQPSE